MRSYLVSLSLVAGCLALYTAIVLNSTPASNAKVEAPRASAELEHREPATASVIPVGD